MCILLFDVFKHLLSRKTEVLKTCQKSKFLRKKIWRNALALKSKKKQFILGKCLFWHHCLKLSFVNKAVSQISFKLFCSGDKRLLSEFLKKWGWFQAHNVCFLKCLGWKLKFQKTETQFWRWKSTDSNNINIFLSLENPCTFLLTKKPWKCVFNTNSELSQNLTAKQIILFKTTINWLFSDIGCYLVIGCFNWKIGVFQQTVVKVYYILKKI